MKKLKVVLITAALASGAFAQSTLIIPASVDANTDGVTATPYPWGTNGFGPFLSHRVQYMYDSSNFASVHTPIAIYRIRFRANDASTTQTGLGGAFLNAQIRLGLAGADYLASGTLFAGNYAGGIEPAPAYSGGIGVAAWAGNGSGAPGNWYVDAVLTTPFVYDPRTGDDFILDVANDGAWTGVIADTWECDEDYNSGSKCKRVITTSGSTQPFGSVTTQEHGLVCELGYTPANGLHAGFTADTTTPGPNQVVTFQDRSTSTHPNGIVFWDWDLDGDSSIDSTQRNPSFVYPSCGARSVTLTVYDGTGSSLFTRTSYIQVGPPQPDFTATWTGTRPVITQFTDTSGGAPTSWAWDFDGDNLTDSTVQNPVWNFLGLGPRTVKLTVANACGSLSKTRTLQILPKLTTGYYNDARIGVTNYTHYFDAQVHSPIGITVTDLGIHSNQNGAVVGATVWIRNGGYAGADGSSAGWQLIGSANAQGRIDGETRLDVPDFFLGPTTWGIAIVYTPGGPRYEYTHRVGSTVSTPELTLNYGVMRSTPFGGSRWEGRAWDGAFYYCAGAGHGVVAPLAAGCTNTTGNIAGLVSQNFQPPTLGQPFTMQMSNARANQALSFIIVGVADLGGLDLGLIGMPTCRLYPEPLFNLAAPTNANGMASASIAIADNLDTIGFPIYAQGVFADPGLNGLGAAVSDALQATVGCR